MSGGSFNHLYLHTGAWGEVEKLMSMTDTIQSMADALTEYGFAEDAAKETEELLLVIKHATRRIEARATRLSGVWHAVEWHHSGDSGADGVKQALKKYREEIEGGAA